MSFVQNSVAHQNHHLDIVRSTELTRCRSRTLAERLDVVRTDDSMALAVNQL